MSRLDHADHLLAKAVMELSGGVEAWTMADAHFGERRQSIRELAEIHELSIGAVHARVRKVWDVCRRYGITPEDWYDRGKGRPSGKTHFTDKPLESRRRLDRRRNGKII